VKPKSKPLILPYNIDVVSSVNDFGDGGFDNDGHCYPADIFPKTIISGDIVFNLGSPEKGNLNALSCRGQEIILPDGNYNRLYILASSLGDAKGKLFINNKPVDISVQDYSDFIGQWDSRYIKGKTAKNPFQIAPAFIKRDEIAWVGTHRHSKTTVEPYQFCYLFKYGIDIPKDARILKLPDNENIRIFAITTALDFNNETKPAQPLYDVISPLTTVSLENEVPNFFADAELVGLKATPDDAEIRYTVDGSEPMPNSILYTSPITVDKSLTIKAKAFTKGGLSGYPLTVELTKLVSKPPEKTGKLLPGLSMNYYEGNWQALPDFSKLKPLKNRITGKIEIPSFAHNENFAVVFTGYIDIQKDGIYYFSSNTDDGSRIYVGNTLVVDNDLSHGPTDVEGAIALKSGKYTIKIEFFQGGGGKLLEVNYAGPDIKKQRIGPNVLWHEK
jgi:hypothetical protein